MAFTYSRQHVLSPQLFTGFATNHLLRLRTPAENSKSAKISRLCMSDSLAVSFLIRQHGNIRLQFMLHVLLSFRHL